MPRGELASTMVVLPRRADDGNVNARQQHHLQLQPQHVPM
jgi:hypothetical protein